MQHFYRRARFLTSAHTFKQVPPDQGWEVAFAGRSNAGKSSAINALTEQTHLARTSKTPGRTQLLNFFELDEQRRLVDLPGYGYAKVPFEIQQHWQFTLETYLQNRQSLQGLIIMMDIRHPLMPFDIQLLKWCEISNLSVHILLTKADKLSRGNSLTVLHKVKSLLKQNNVSVQLFSSLDKIGLEAAYSKLNEWLHVET
jgi:GTP-binding protein